MACSIEEDDIEKGFLSTLLSELTCVSELDRMNNRKYLMLYRKRKKSILVPIRFHQSVYEGKANDEYLNSYVRTGGWKLYNPPRENQVELLQRAREILEEQQTVLLNLSTNFGKTYMALNLISVIGLRAMIVVHTTPLKDQWVERIKEHTSANIPNDIDVNCVQSIVRWERDKVDISYGVLVLDEAHTIPTVTFSQCIFHFRPRYVIGLSATTQRDDGLDVVLRKMFGDYVVRKTKKKGMRVYVYRSPFKPHIVSRHDGMLDWKEVLSSLCSRKERNEFLIQTIKNHIHEIEDDSKILILTKRNSRPPHSKDLADLSENELDLKVKRLFGYQSKKKAEEKEMRRVIVGTYSKIGTGFDDPSIQMCLLAVDTTKIEQAVGRVRHRRAIIIDVVDNFSVLWKHFKKRLEIYKGIGADVIYV